MSMLQYYLSNLLKRCRKTEKINAIISLIPSMMVQFQCEGAQVKDIELAPQVKL